eukprot:TRINITY_DN7345_c0_g1_i3.p1 TRINITY_DN7345_c0_g1~~TRINITY_DN7345_c0_g1_i3.p1  ORF type:complete len:286 (-),score=64.78 TRINITY_DN7345_c0_g1_i3:135-992(-)
MGRQTRCARLSKTTFSTYSNPSASSKKLQPVPAQLLEKKKVRLDSKGAKLKTVVFDLDETLVHCTTSGVGSAQHVIGIQLPTGERVRAGINIRPRLAECLKRLAEHFELIVFTASHRFYAEKVLELIDPHKILFSHRLFRENCIRTETGFYIKDLRILNRDLKSTLIVDNSMVSFAFQPDNGIPILPFYDNGQDEELVRVANYLMALKNLDDVRTGNKAAFGIQQMYKLNVARFLRYYEDADNSFEESLKVSKSAQATKGKPETLVETELSELKKSLPTYLSRLR